ncbi:hypothetical protein HNY73_009356 [Argiope bruennichi]|uniref:Mos1 transposase HTH domain-containing protein n=1 Tax=Argiope bruennichi TaxID=94029 RepID=A0A8T0F997_ARGBR|nr:hypothetical protein HNY73_009356 [Argiope bruennichi]
MDRNEFRVLIKYCFLMEKNTVEAKQWLDKHYGDSEPGKSTVIDWYAEFKSYRSSTDEAESSGRPKSAVVPISEGSVFRILLENLGMASYFRSAAFAHTGPANKASTIQSAV